MLRPPRQLRNRGAEREREREKAWHRVSAVATNYTRHAAKQTKERASLLARLPSSSEPKQGARTHKQQRVAEQTREGFEKARDHRTWTHMSKKGKLVSTHVQRHGTRVVGDESSAARRRETSLPHGLRHLLTTAFSQQFLLLTAFRIRCRGSIVSLRRNDSDRGGTKQRPALLTSSHMSSFSNVTSWASHFLPHLALAVRIRLHFTSQTSQ